MTTIKVLISGSCGNKLEVTVLLSNDNDTTEVLNEIECKETPRYQGAISDKSDQPVEFKRALSKQESDTLATAIGKFNVQAIPEHSYGLDGYHVTLSIDRGFNAVSYRWWVDPPAGWRKLGSIVDVVLRVASVEKALARVLTGP